MIWKLFKHKGFVTVFKYKNKVLIKHTPEVGIWIQERGFYSSGLWDCLQ